MLLVPANGAFPILFPACLWDSVKQLLTWPSFASWSALNCLAVLRGQECRKIKKSWVKINFIDILENRVLLNEWLAKGTPALFGLQHRWGLQSPRAQGCGLRQPGRVPRQSHAALESCQSEAMPRAQGWYKSYFHTQKAGETTRHGVSSFPLGKMWCVLLGLTQQHPQFKVQPPVCSRLLKAKSLWKYSQIILFEDNSWNFLVLPAVCMHFGPCLKGAKLCLERWWELWHPWWAQAPAKK